MFVKFRYLFAFLLILLIPFQALSDQAEQSDTSENAVLLILGDSLSAAYGLQQHEGWSVCYKTCGKTTTFRLIL